MRDDSPAKRFAEGGVSEYYSAHEGFEVIAGSEPADRDSNSTNISNRGERNEHTSRRQQRFSGSTYPARVCIPERNDFDLDRGQHGGHYAYAIGGRDASSSSMCCESDWNVLQPDVHVGLHAAWSANADFSDGERSDYPGESSTHGNDH